MTITTISQTILRLDNRGDGQDNSEHLSVQKLPSKGDRQGKRI